MFKISVIGAGYWGRKVIAEYCAIARTRKDLEVSFVADLSKNAVGSIATNFPDVQRTSTNVDSVLTHKDVDAVHICTPNETHFGLALQALKAGKHVLLEKPMALTGHECYKLVEEASSRKLVLQVGHIFRFNEAVRRLRHLVQDGALGRIYSLRIRWSAYLVPLPSRDIIFDLGPHPVDICNFVLNEWPYKVMGRSKSYVRNKPGREEEALFVMEFPKGKDAFVELSWISPGEKMREVYVRGSKATVKVDALRQHVRLYESSATGQLADIGQSIEVTENNTIATEVEHFIKQILGSRTSVSSGYIGARTVEVLEAVRRSSMDERSVYLQERPERSDFSQGTAYSSSKGVRSEIKLEFATK